MSEKKTTDQGEFKPLAGKAREYAAMSDEIKAGEELCRQLGLQRWDEIKQHIESLRSENKRLQERVRELEQNNGALNKENDAWNEWVKKLEEQLSQSLAREAVYVGHLKNVFDLIDQQFLVRNIDQDGDADWAFKAIEPLRKLSEAAKALSSASPRAKAMLEVVDAARSDLESDDLRQARLRGALDALDKEGV